MKFFNPIYVGGNQVTDASGNILSARIPVLDWSNFSTDSPTFSGLSLNNILTIGGGGCINDDGILLGGDMGIEFIESTYGSGYGHYIYSQDLGDGHATTTLNIAGRSGSTSWSRYFAMTNDGRFYFSDSLTPDNYDSYRINVTGGINTDDLIIDGSPACRWRGAHDTGAGGQEVLSDVRSGDIYYEITNGNDGNYGTNQGLWLYVDATRGWKQIG